MATEEPASAAGGLERFDSATSAEKIAILSQAIAATTKEADPMTWASLHGALGAALVENASGRFDAALIERILAAYAAASSVFDPDRTSDVWLRTQADLANTHVLAIQSGAGDTRAHVEAAISIDQDALRRGRFESNPNAWIACHRDLVFALHIAAEWQGPDALRRAAGACEGALRVVSKESSAEAWAWFNLKLGQCLVQSGGDLERAIAACDESLLILRREAQPLFWAEANLVLGRAYRLRRAGDRALNLERAITALDGVLTVLSPDNHLQGWYSAHFERGPAYAYRMRGDRHENQERAIESLTIAIGGTSRAHTPDIWASLQMTLGEIHLDRSTDRVEGSLARAAAAFEASLQAVPSRDQAVWLRASRRLGYAYLRWKGADQNEKIERAFALLEEAQGSQAARDNVADWCAAHADLARAYMHRDGGRDRAIQCLEEALAVASDSWSNPSEWSQAQRSLLAALASPDAGTPSAPSQSAVTTEADVAGSAPQDDTPSYRDRLAGLAQSQLASLQADLELQRVADFDRDWHVPFLLNEEVAQLGLELKQFLNSGEVFGRTREARTALERRRLWLFQAIFEHLVEKYCTAAETQSLFRDWKESGRSFVLLLRGFEERAEYFVHGSMTHATTFGEGMERKRIIRELGRIPLVYVTNPVESGPLKVVGDQIVGIEATGSEARGFRVEMGSEWESGVRTLISAASAIIVYNQGTTKGVVKEIQFIEQLGRRADTYFHDPVAAAAILGVDAAGCKPADAQGFEQMRNAKAVDPVAVETLPSPICLWIGGDRRASVESEIGMLGRWLNRVGPDPGAVALDLRLDANMHLLSHILLLERLDLLPARLAAISSALRVLGDERLEGADVLADRYAGAADDAQSALANVPSGLSTGDAASAVVLGMIAKAQASSSVDSHIKTE